MYSTQTDREMKIKKETKFFLIQSSSKYHNGIGSSVVDKLSQHPPALLALKAILDPQIMAHI